MGWDFTHRERGTSNVEYFGRDFADGYELLDGATVGGTFYGALRQPDGSVTATVTLTRWVPRDYFNFGTKDMTESWGPVENRCPVRILDMLTPTDDTVANEWRARCRAYHERVGSVKRGTVIRHAGSTYTAVDLRRNLFRGGGILYRFPHWRSVEFEVVTDAD